MMNKEIPDFVRREIKRIRLEKNWSQQTMADKLFMAQNAYSKLELGRTLLDIERLAKIADVYGISVNDLLCESNNPNASTEDPLN